MADSMWRGPVMRELAYRANDGLEVALLWRALENRLAVSVCARTGEHFVLDAENGNPLDVFHHPYAHAALQAGRVVARDRRSFR